MEPNKESQWTWPDTSEYKKAYKEGETELAETRRIINKFFLFLIVTCILFAAYLIFCAYILTHK